MNRRIDVSTKGSVYNAFKARGLALRNQGLLNTAAALALYVIVEQRIREAVNKGRFKTSVGAFSSKYVLPELCQLKALALYYRSKGYYVSSTTLFHSVVEIEIAWSDHPKTLWQRFMEACDTL